MQALLITIGLMAFMSLGHCIGYKACYEHHQKEIEVGQQVIAIKENEARLVKRLQSDFEKAGLCDTWEGVECEWQGK